MSTHESQPKDGISPVIPRKTPPELERDVTGPADPVSVRVGFSRRRNNAISFIIRWATGAKTSHAWLLVQDTFFGMDMVLEATDTGFRLVPFENFKAEDNQVVTIIDPPYPLDHGVQVAARWLGESYDFAGLFGEIFVLMGRWLRRKWRNPLASPHAMFCSEAVVRVMQASSYPGSETLDPPATTPQDLLDFFAKNGATQTELERAPAFSMPR